ncbi:MAG TPA: hypothetical protein VK599_01275 [Streptosporangiaceae bacterium]|nr:hypothetical protein [Streptosporangiaceae bacterium]
MEDLDQEHRTSGRRRLDLSLVQVAASALAAVVAAVLASELGVYGTIAGAAVVSIGATTGAAVFQHLFRRTGEELRSRVPAGTAADPSPAQQSLPGESVSTYRSGTRIRPKGRLTYALVAGLVFALAMGAVTVVELVAGKPLAAVVRNEPGNGTSWGGAAGDGAPVPARTPSRSPSDGATTEPGRSSVPDPSSTPSAGGSTTPSADPSGGATSGPPTSTPSSSPVGSGGATGTPTADPAP